MTSSISRAKCTLEHNKASANPATTSTKVTTGKLTFLVLNLGLDVVDGVRRLHLKGDCLASQSLHKDLHVV